MNHIRTLMSFELPKFTDHLLRLDGEDRRLRFGHRISDAEIEAFVAGLEKGRFRVLAHFDDELNVAATALLSALNDGSVEFAFSVDRPLRQKGLCTSLFDRAILWARNRRIDRAYLYTLAEHRQMRHLARTAGMHLDVEAGGCEGVLDLPPATPLTLLREILAEQAGMYDTATKANHLALAHLRTLRKAA
ncbi:MAG: GNAT family N-acetyltransferase [Rhodospirillales bacterium]|nr:GNAT family N-acetyltransferase [Rhodospirillales bacterium]